MKLNYESINNNAAGSRDPHYYDYSVQDEVSLAKLFMESHMAHFNAFASFLMLQRLWLFFAVLRHSGLRSCLLHV